MPSNNPAEHNVRGSLWNRWDLHFHTPSSFDYENGSVTNQNIVDSLVEKGIKVVAITDHHQIDVARIRELQQLARNKLTILPGIELRDDHGDKPIHYICIFSEDCDLDHVWTTLQGALGLTATAIREKGGDDKVYVPIETGANETRKLGGVVSIHAGCKSNSINGIQNKEQFQQRIKFDITKNWVDLMEIGQLKDIDAHLNIIFPATGLEKPLIICSDNHDITQYAVKSPLWFRADPTFRGLLMVLREPQGRVFIGERPPEHIRPEQLDYEFHPRDIFCPRSVDSSQLAAVMAAAAGHDFVLEGPPGTGKSQTIANIIAHCLAHGKRVLFVAEKRAALDVVYRRLREEGLEPFCLELHSNKTGKADVIAQFDRSLRFISDDGATDWEHRAAELERLRDTLNNYARALHRRHDCGLSAYRCLDYLLPRQKEPMVHLNSWPSILNTPIETLERAREMAKLLQQRSRPLIPLADHPLSLLGCDEWTPAWADRVLGRIRELGPLVKSADDATSELRTCPKLI